MNPWKLIGTAPRDGTKIDLLFPYPRGRTIDCFWKGEQGFGWVWLVPRWEPANLDPVPEAEWSVSCYPNMEPTHWMKRPEMPE